MMVVECLAIIAVILLVIFVFLRSRKPGYALLTLPLVIVPFFHCIGQLFGVALANSWGLPFQALVVAIDVAALAISCAIIAALVQNKLTTNRQRKGFLIVSCTYQILLTWVFIFNVIV